MWQYYERYSVDYINIVGWKLCAILHVRLAENIQIPKYLRNKIGERNVSKFHRYNQRIHCNRAKRLEQQNNGDTNKTKKNNKNRR